LIFQHRAIKNQAELEVIARQIQKSNDSINSAQYWNTRHIKVYTDTNNYHSEIINHAEFRVGDRCNTSDLELPLNPKQKKLLINKLKISEIRSSIILECRDQYVYGDSAVIFINHGKFDFLGIGKDHILFIDLRMTPRQVLLQEQAKKCYFTHKYDRAYKITDRIFYAIEKHIAFWGS
jgi:hypothetical protein